MRCREVAGGPTRATCKRRSTAVLMALGGRFPRPRRPPTAHCWGSAGMIALLAPHVRASAVPLATLSAARDPLAYLAPHPTVVEPAATTTVSPAATTTPPWLSASLVLPTVATSSPSSRSSLYSPPTDVCSTYACSSAVTLVLCNGSSWVLALTCRYRALERADEEEEAPTAK